MARASASQPGYGSTPRRIHFAALATPAGNLLAALLTHPEQLAAVRREGALVPAAVEEAVRWECPAVSVPRIARRDVDLAGTRIPAGSAVRVV
ncbi:MAG TPA: hypothetical protein PLU22_11105, partial [Polyangiaceae bacterium]|nr:hypothetical protein [Polyangiaceae bacterium]